MKSVRAAILAGCLGVALISSAQATAIPNVVGTFVADVGKSRLVSAMKGCKRSATKPFGHKITLYDNGTFKQEIDLNGDDIADSVTTGLWVEPRPGKIAMIYDGDIALGAGGTGGWAALLGEAEASLRQQCTDNSVGVLLGTIYAKRLSLTLNKQRDRAVFASEIDAYAQGGFTGIGAVRLAAHAKGNYQAAP
jgi:hypothetical protein